MTDEEDAVFDAALAFLPDLPHLAVTLLEQKASLIDAVRLVALQLVQVVACVHCARLQDTHRVVEACRTVINMQTHAAHTRYYVHYTEAQLKVNNSDMCVQIYEKCKTDQIEHMKTYRLHAMHFI